MVSSFVAKQISLLSVTGCHGTPRFSDRHFRCPSKWVLACGIDSMDLDLGTGEDPSQFETRIMEFWSRELGTKLVPIYDDV